ncbi:MAG: hypothetical protein KC910_10855 [Candidatus Eremiobacteraeota bacterium]|nr:hypothetical protein [Candidatus Eremiobacteraeota bacterium]
MSGLALGGALLAAAWLWLYRRLVDPAAGQRVVGHLLEIGLYRDLPRQILACLADLLRASLVWGRQLLRPGLAFLVPLAWVTLPLYGYWHARPLEVGESVLVRGSQLEVPEGVTIEAGPVTLDSQRVWRLKASRPGDFALLVGGQQVTLRVGQGWVWSSRLGYPPRQLWLGDRSLPWWLALLVWAGLFTLALSLAPFGRG